MKKNIFSAVAASSLIISAGYAQSIPNGEPFQALNDLIKANSEQIERNTYLINENAALIEQNRISITDLQSYISGIYNSVNSLESKIQNNKNSITSLIDKIEIINGDIAKLDVDLDQLYTSINSSLKDISDEIDGLKLSISSLTSNLSTLNMQMSAAVDDLDKAIASNSDDITILEAIVTSMDSKITMINTEILIAQSKIDNAEQNAQTLYSQLPILESLIASLGIRVSFLEENGCCKDGCCASDDNTTTPPPVSTLREFTITGTSADDLSVDGFKAQIASLEYKSGEFLYIKGVSSSAANEFCTSNPEAAGVIDAYINSNSKNWYTNYPSDTWQNSSNTLDWEVAVYAKGFSQSWDGGFGFESQDGTNSHNVVKNFVFPAQTKYEILTNWTYDYLRENTMTFKVAKTRQEACGF